MATEAVEEAVDGDVPRVLGSRPKVPTKLRSGGGRGRYTGSDADLLVACRIVWRERELALDTELGLESPPVANLAGGKRCFDNQAS